MVSDKDIAGEKCLLKNYAALALIVLVERMPKLGEEYSPITREVLADAIGFDSPAGEQDEILRQKTEARWLKRVDKILEHVGNLLGECSSGKAPNIQNMVVRTGTPKEQEEQQKEGKRVVEFCVSEWRFLAMKIAGKRLALYRRYEP